MTKVLRPINPEDTIEYVPRDFRDDKGNPLENAPKFYLGYLSPAQWAEVQDALTDVQFPAVGPQNAIPVKITPGSRFVKALQYGLKGWDWKDEKGNPVPFKKVTKMEGGVKVTYASMESILKIPRKYWLEIATEVLRLNGFTEEEASFLRQSSGPT